jgi:hypothetical protein
MSGRRGVMIAVAISAAAGEAAVAESVRSSTDRYPDPFAALEAVTLEVTHLGFWLGLREKALARARVKLREQRAELRALRSQKAIRPDGTGA